MWCLLDPSRRDWIASGQPRSISDPQQVLPLPKFALEAHALGVRKRLCRRLGNKKEPGLAGRALCFIGTSNQAAVVPPANRMVGHVVIPRPPGHQRGALHVACNITILSGLGSPGVSRQAAPPKLRGAASANKTLAILNRMLARIVLFWRGGT